MGGQLQVFLAVKDFPQHREQIHRGEDHANGRQALDHDPERQGVGVVGGEAHKDHQLGDKATHPWQGQGCQRADGPEGKHFAHLLPYPAHLIELQGVGAVVGGTHQEKQAGSNQPVADHLEHGATAAEGTKAADADQHKPHVADGAVGNFAFEVALGEGGEGGINDVHHPQHDQQRRELGVGIGQDLTVEAQQGVAAHLQQNPCQQHVHRGGGFPVGIGQPGVQGHDRELHPKGDQQPRITEQLEPRWEALGHQGGILKRGNSPAVEGHGQPRQQDEQGASCGVKDELGGGVLALFATPDRQQQIDGQQFQFPGQEEQQHVLHGEDGDLAAIHGQEQEEEELGFEGDRPGRQHRQRGDEAGEKDQGHRDAIGAHRPGQADIGQPLHPLHQLQARVARVVAVEVPAHRQQEGDQGHAQGVPAHLFALALIREEGDQQGRGNREQD